MKFESKELVNGKTVITTSRRFLFWSAITQYECQREFVEGYWEWLKLPNRDLICDRVSFQLDAWNRIY